MVLIDFSEQQPPASAVCLGNTDFHRGSLAGLATPRMPPKTLSLSTSLRGGVSNHNPSLALQAGMLKPKDAMGSPEGFYSSAEE